ncbi:MAG: DUF3667 domain-containing protein [Saprospiraceae bacterium]
MEIEQTPRPERITMRTIWQGILDGLSLERGLIGTTITLTKRPAQAIRNYLLEDRTHLMPPFRYLLFMVAIGTFLTVQYFNNNGSLISKFKEGVEKGYNAESDATTDVEKQQFLQTYLENTTYLFNNYFNLFIVLGVPVAAVATMWFFRRRFNYAEHLVINSYVTGYLTVIYIALFPILFITDFAVLSGIYFIATFAYSIIVYKNVYQSVGVRGYVAASGAMLIYLILYYMLMIVLFISLAFIALAKQFGN